jgi:hypothetical protein
MVEPTVKTRINNIRYNADKYIDFERLIKDIATADEQRKPNAGRLQDIDVLKSEYINLDNLILEILKSCNYTYQDIGDIYELSRQAVFNRIKYNSLI